MNKEYWRLILIRAWHAVWETAAATLPATIVITPAMIEHFDKSVLVAAAAWMATALAAGAVSIIKSLAIGIPEAAIAEDEIDYLEDLKDKVTVIERSEELKPGDRLYAVLSDPKEDTTREGMTRQEAADLWLVGAEVEKSEETTDNEDAEIGGKAGE